MKLKHPTVNVSFEIENCVFQTLSITHFLFDTSLPGHSHGSNSYEIHYVISGYGKVKLEDKYYDLKPNTFYVNGPHVVHSQIPLRENPMCEYVIQLQIDSTKNKNKDADPNSITQLFQKHPYWIGEGTQNLQNIIHQIFYEIDHQYLGYEECLKSLMQLLILSSVRVFAEKDLVEPPIIRSSTVNTKSIIIDDYFLYEYKTLSLEGLSERLGLSPRQTERYLKEHYNKTFIQKKTESKMSTAALLLSNRKNNITYISDELGYSSIEHFSTAFKRYYGCSPSDYRKMLLNHKV